MPDSKPDILNLYADFGKRYKEDWTEKSTVFREFLNTRIFDNRGGELTDDEIDNIVRILDTNGKGKTKDDVSVARVMVPQGGWRRLFRELRGNSELSSILKKILEEDDEIQVAKLIDEYYKLNKEGRNYLTGQSANVIDSFLFLYSPSKYLSIVSLSDRRRVIEYFGFVNGPDFEKDTTGVKVIKSNRAIIDGFREIGIDGSPRAISTFLYDSMLPFWKQNVDTMHAQNSEIIVTIPEDEEETISSSETGSEEVSQSKVVQAKICKIGEDLGFKIWLPKPDRSRVLDYWTPKPETLLDELEVGFSGLALKIVKNIDVLWVNTQFSHDIVRAFEVEHTTSIYSGILRMTDLMTVLPNLNIKTHIVASENRKAKVFDELNRPTIKSILTRKESNGLCTYISYESINHLFEDKGLKHSKDSIIEMYVEDPEGNI